MDHTEYWETIAAFADRATTARDEFVPPEDPPDEQRATEFLQNGVGPIVSTYIEARSSDGWTQFPPVEHSLLERSLNDYLELYARCYGYEIECEFSVREAAETVVQTHNIEDTAHLLTKVPPREEMSTAWQARGRGPAADEADDED